MISTIVAATVASQTLLASAPVIAGKASWYGPGFHGRRTANGEVFDQNGFTAAHKTLPFGTILCVKNSANGRKVTVRINDRGPYSGGRVLDLSRGAMDSIGGISAGVVHVTATSGRC